MCEVVTADPSWLCPVGCSHLRSHATWAPKSLPPVPLWHEAIGQSSFHPRPLLLMPQWWRLLWASMSDLLAVPEAFAPQPWMNHRCDTSLCGCSCLLCFKGGCTLALGKVLVCSCFRSVYRNFRWGSTAFGGKSDFLSKLSFLKNCKRNKMHFFNLRLAFLNITVSSHIAESKSCLSPVVIVDHKMPMTQRNNAVTHKHILWMPFWSVLGVVLYWR